MQTLEFRHFLWDQGLGLAEAMDTAQRGMGLDWLTAKELIERTMVGAKKPSTQTTSSMRRWGQISFEVQTVEQRRRYCRGIFRADGSD